MTTEIVPLYQNLMVGVINLVLHGKPFDATNHFVQQSRFVEIVELIKKGECDHPEFLWI